MKLSRLAIVQCSDREPSCGIEACTLYVTHCWRGSVSFSADWLIDKHQCRSLRCQIRNMSLYNHSSVQNMFRCVISAKNGRHSIAVVIISVFFFTVFFSLFPIIAQREKVSREQKSIRMLPLPYSFNISNLYQTITAYIKPYIEVISRNRIEIETRVTSDEIQ